MNTPFVLNLFLYFPEDKSEYIPAGITMVIFAVLALVTFRFIVKYSKKQELQTKELEEQVKARVNGDNEYDKQRYDK